LTNYENYYCGNLSSNDYYLNVMSL